ncbi:DUF2087 domain-containing protein [Niameybacter massiliensis]|uniref:DUF2087 domain-containing protein n=1 Tax=Niameybacter massiliensis TaxID=1658108 RepID=UPI0006B60DFC|nr:DUF2087 domain-containing protein [Niameybacter massiliensis]
MEENNRMWDEDIETIVKGYRETNEHFVCVLCGCTFEKGRIYKVEGELYDAFGAVKKHMQQKHGETIDYLLSRNPELMGISEIQQRILTLMSQGKDDKMIAKEVGIAHSTVRNHRYKLREKEKQAKLFVALMQSLEEKTSRCMSQSDNGVIEHLHDTATMMDDRYNITDTEREKTIKAYMDTNGAIKQFPAKEKKKIIILREVMKNFTKDREYPEKEINRTLGRLYEDYATIRRALIEYGFLDRSDDCQTYRVKE